MDTHDVQQLSDGAKPLAVMTNEGFVGLPVQGYKPTQSAEAIDTVNRFKVLEERVLREIDVLMDGNTRDEPFVDPRLLAIGRTQLQGAFMFLARSIFQPQRISLPEDSVASEMGTYAGHEALNVKPE